jgi:hypothetical protein
MTSIRNIFLSCAIQKKEEERNKERRNSMTTLYFFFSLHGEKEARLLLQRFLYKPGNGYIDVNFSCGGLQRQLLVFIRM